MKGFNMTALILMAIGALNWLLVGVADFNLVAALFGADTVLTNTVYIIVGVAAIAALVTYPWGARESEYTTTRRPRHA